MSTILKCLFIFVGFYLCEANSDMVKGAVQLNSGVFDKIVQKYKVVLVKFSETYPYGDKQDVFKKISELAISQPELMCGEVQIADYGNNENADLGEKFGISKADYPAYRLFVNGDQSNPIIFAGDVGKVDELQKFIIKNSGLWLGLPGCLEEFDEITKEFVVEPSKTILEKAEKQVATLENDVDKSNADTYIKIMKKCLDAGLSFVDTEIARLEKLRDGKVSDKKKEQLSERLNVLMSFQMHISNNKKEEL